MGTPRYLHYHITIVGPPVMFVTQIANTYEELQTKITKLRNTVADLTGSKIKETTEYITTFENGAQIKWRPCQESVCGVESHEQKSE